MSESSKQVMDIRPGKGFTKAQSDEHQRNWSEKAWQHAVGKGNYDRSRSHLNFEIAKGCVVQPVDKTKSIPQRMAENLASRGIRDPNEGLAQPRFRTVANIIFSGNAKRMYEMAFGDQEIDYAKGADNGHIQRSESIEQWAQDMYRFACGQWGEENIVQFICHLDEKSPHLHVTIVPVTEQKKVSFKRVFAGEDKFAFSRHMRELHDKLAEVNARWGLARGTSTGNKHVSNEEYNKMLAKENEQLEEKIASNTITLSELMTRVKRAQNAVKGLNTMLTNLNAQKKQVEAELDELRKTTATTDAQRRGIESQIAEKEQRLSKIDTGIADKTAKLEIAKENLEEMERLASDAKASYETMQKSMRESAQSMRGQISSKLAQAGFEEMINTFTPLFSRMALEKDIQLFDGTLLKDMAERGNAIFTCASLLFVGYVDQATQVAKDCGGGGSSSDLPWGRKDDEDDRAWARRCLLQAQAMTRPASGRKVKRR